MNKQRSQKSPRNELLFQGLKRGLNWAVVGVGFLQMAGWIFGLNQIEMLGRLTGASPLPLVFNQVEGLEYWASGFDVHLKMENGTNRDFKITPALFSKVHGPHLLHMAYAMPFAFSPIAPAEFWEPPLRYGLCRPGKLAQDFEIQGVIRSVTLRISSQSGGKERHWDRGVECLP